MRSPVTRIGRITRITRIILFFLLGSSMSSQAQIHTGFGGGTDFHYPLWQLYAGYETHGAVVEYDMQVTATNQADSHDLFGLKAGYNFGGIIPSVGIYRDMVSSDNPELNGWHAGYSLRVYKLINECGGFYFNALYARQIQFSIGIAAVIKTRNQ